MVSASCSTTMHAVAEIAQPPQRRDEPQVVALVQADRRLVEHVHHARQLRAELRRQPDALRLAARQRGRRAIERQVVEADVEQEAEAGVDLLQDLGGDLRARARRGPASRSAARASATVMRRDVDDASCSARNTARDSGRRRTPLQARHELLAEVACRTTGASPRRTISCMRFLMVLTTPGEAHGPRAAAVLAAPSLTFTRCSPEPNRMHLALARRELLPGLVELDAELARDGGGRCWRSSPLSLPARSPQGSMAPSLIDRLAVGDDQVGVDLQARAEAVAVDAHAERGVERERSAATARADRRRTRGRRAPRCRRARASRPRRRPALSRPPALRAVSTESVRRARSPASSVDAIDRRSRWCASSSCRGRDVLEPLDHCRRCARARSRPCAPPRRPRGTRPCGSRPCGASSVTLVLGRQRQQLVDDLGRRAGGDRAAAQVAALLAGARVEDAQVVVDLGDRADGGARVRRGRLLLDGDGRRQPAELLVLGLLHLAEELRARTTTATRRSGAAPRRRACRTRATTCPSPTRR